MGIPGASGGFPDLYMCIVHCVLSIVYCALCTVQCELCFVYCALFTVHCILCIVHCAVCIVLCILSIVYCAMCIVHYVLCIVLRQQPLEGSLLKARVCEPRGLNLGKFCTENLPKNRFPYQLLNPFWGY